jgi:hypothetical protein
VDQWAPAAAVTAIAGFSLLFAMVGADARWLAALGRIITARGAIVNGVPFAAAPAAHWHNVIALAELAFWGLQSTLGDRGLALAQALAVGVAFGTLAIDAVSAGATRRSAASACLLTALGIAPALVIVRVQLFSLALFPVLLALLRADARRRSRKIWLSAPLLALWANLHGGVLAGLALTLLYLGLVRLRERPTHTVAIMALCVLALCANPAGTDVFAYFRGLLGNEAAQRGAGMWGPLSPSSPADLLLMAAAAVLAARAWRAGPRLWERVAIVLLAAMTVHAARSGIWLLFVLLAPAAVGTPVRSAWRARTVALAAAGSVGIVLGCLRGPAPSGADRQIIASAIARAGTTPILATDVAAEQVALAGGRVWASDPIDAFRRQAQRAYLEWTDGSPGGLNATGDIVRVALVAIGSGAAGLMEHTPSFHVVLRQHGYELLVRPG